MRLMLITAVGEGYDCWYSHIGVPNDTFPSKGCIKSEGGILFVKTVIIATGQKGADAKPSFLPLANEPPRSITTLA